MLLYKLIPNQWYSLWYDTFWWMQLLLASGIRILLNMRFNTLDIYLYDYLCLCNSTMFWNHMWESAQSRALCIKISEVNLSADCFMKISLPSLEQIQLAILNHPHALIKIIYADILGSMRSVHCQLNENRNVQVIILPLQRKCNIQCVSCNKTGVVNHMLCGTILCLFSVLTSIYTDYSHDKVRW